MGLLSVCKEGGVAAHQTNLTYLHSVKIMKKKSHTDWKRLKSMKDDNIDLSDIPLLGSHFFKNAKLRLPGPKSTVTMRLDPDILKWFRGQGKGYQTRINAILRMYIDAQRG